MVRGIPTIYSFRFFWIGFITLILLLAVLTGIYFPGMLPLGTDGLSALSDLWLAMVFVYLFAEMTNIYSRLLQHGDTYQFDETGVYCNGIIAMRWSEVDAVLFRHETKKVILPPSRIVRPSGAVLRQVPERRRTVTEARITVIGKNSLNRREKELSIPTTKFKPLLKSKFNSMKLASNKGGVSVDFSYRSLGLSDRPEMLPAE